MDVSTAVGGHEQQDVRVSGAGIPLHGSRSQSISIIADPYTKNRALLLVTFDVPVIGGDNIIKYAVYQLQTHQRPQRKSETVLSRLFASGSTTLTSQSATGIFLAGGSFSFQLNTEQEYKGKRLRLLFRCSDMVSSVLSVKLCTGNRAKKHISSSDRCRNAVAGTDCIVRF